MQVNIFLTVETPDCDRCRFLQAVIVGIGSHQTGVFFITFITDCAILCLSSLRRQQ